MVIPFFPDDEERIELDALRLENDTLRRHLGRLEEKIQKAEEKVLLDQEQWQTHQEEVPQFRNDRQQLKQDDSSERKIPITTQGFNAPNEVCHLHGILQWLNVRHWFSDALFNTFMLAGQICSA